MPPNPLEFPDKTYPAKTRGMGLPYGENFIILASTVFLWYVTRLTDGPAIAYSALRILLPRAKNSNTVEVQHISWSWYEMFFLSSVLVLRFGCATQSYFLRYLHAGKRLISYQSINTRTKTCSCHLTVVWRPLYEELLAISTQTIHRWKVHLVGYNSVADNTGLSSFV